MSFTVIIGAVCLIVGAAMGRWIEAHRVATHVKEHAALMHRLSQQD